MRKLLSKRWLKTPTFGVKRALSHDFRYPICTSRAHWLVRDIHTHVLATTGGAEE